MTHHKIRPWAKASLITGAGAVVAALVFSGAVYFGLTGQTVSFYGVVYSFLGLGAVGCVGLAFAITSLIKRERGIGLAAAGLMLNLVLTFAGSCFLILLPTS